MSAEDVTPEQSDRPGGGLSRRGLLRNTAGLGAATVAAGLLANALATPASAQGTAAAPAAATRAPGAVPAGEPIVAHVRDARTGEIDLFVGTRHHRFTDHELAARLARAAH